MTTQGKNTIKITFDSSLGNTFDPTGNSINLNSQIGWHAFHEMFHGYQFNRYYKDVSANIWNNAGANIELEAWMATYRYIINMPKGKDKRQALETIKKTEFYKMVNDLNKYLDSKGNVVNISEVQYNQMFIGYAQQLTSLDGYKNEKVNTSWNVSDNLKFIAQLSIDC